MRRIAVLLCVSTLALTASACGVGAGRQVNDVRVSVTSDFGAQVVGRADASGAGEDTVMRLLQRRFRVETRYGGQFVQAIEGIAGGKRSGRPVDWFYYVNGIEASEGAAARRIVRGDRVWWDHHAWDGAMRVPAVVGSFPEPFRSGTDGKRVPVRLDCGVTQRSCDEVTTRLANAGIKAVGRSRIGQPVTDEVLRIVVAPWSEARRDAAIRSIERGPEVSGVFARFVDGGKRLELLDSRGRVARTLGPGSGLIAATRWRDQMPAWVVTGTDEVGLAAAAAALDEGILGDRFALAVSEGRGIPLPVRPAGAPQP